AYRRQEAVEETATVEVIVEDRELDSGCLIEHPKPVPDGLEIKRHGRCLLPLPACGERERTARAARASRSLLRILLVHLLEERGSLNAPLLLEFDQLAGAVPF